MPDKTYWCRDCDHRITTEPGPSDDGLGAMLWTSQTTGNWRCEVTGKEHVSRPEPQRIMDGRGFARHHPVPSEYGGEVKVYESSAASGPHIWLNAVCPVNLNEPHGQLKEATIHLTLANAALLRDQLTDLIDNHYQER